MKVYEKNSYKNCICKFIYELAYSVVHVKHGLRLICKEYLCFQLVCGDGKQRVFITITFKNVLKTFGTYNI